MARFRTGYVTSDGWKYIRYYKKGAGKDGAYEKAIMTTDKAPVFEQLFHLADDPGETKNVLGQLENETRLQTLRKSCNDSVADLFRQYERYSGRYF